MATPPDFSVAQVLTAAHMSAVGLWLVKEQVIGSDVGNVTVTDAFSADYENYKITISGGSAAGATALELQLGAATTGYYAGYTIVTYSTGAVTGTANNNASSWTLAGSASTDSIHMNVELMSPFLTETTQIWGQGQVGLAVARQISGILNDTTSYTSFKVTATSQNLTGGTIRVYGYRA
jgi:hypothetical protein